jgi:alkylated DNA repair dioxygenase AlkB
VAEQSQFNFQPVGTPDGKANLVEEPPQPSIRVPGLRYHRSFIGEERQRIMMDCIDSAPWMTDLRRRVQHYGWRYDYSSRFVSEDMRAAPLPKPMHDLAEELHERGWFSRPPDQVIVNEYQPGQGIAPHVDRNCFGPTVATLSLGDSWPMEFTRVRRYAAHEEQVKLVLNVGSILVLTGEARSTWMHGIAKRKTDGRASNRRARRRRVSVTFRTMDVVGSEVVGAVMLDLSTT